MSGPYSTSGMTIIEPCVYYSSIAIDVATSLF